MREQLIQFAVEGTDNRLSKLKELLDESHIEYEVQSYPDQRVNNVIVRLNADKISDNKKAVAIVAHYDVVNRSKGINDNAVAVLAAIELIKKLREKNVNRAIDFVFTDREETGMVGSKVYIQDNRDRIGYAISLDILGYGDQLVFSTNAPKVFDRIFEGTNTKRLVDMLPGDNVSFNAAGIPNALLVAAHNDDLTDLKDGSHKLTSFPKFYESFHNRKKDNNIEVINFEIIREAIETVNSLF